MPLMSDVRGVERGLQTTTYEYNKQLNTVVVAIA